MRTFKIANVKNIWAVGRNYAAHAQELGNKVTEKPLIFLKSGSCAVVSQMLSWPAWAQDVHHEVELALLIGPQLEISAWGLSLDLTERKIQAELKTQGHPWTLAKSFIGACPLGDFRNDLKWESLVDAEISLSVNQKVRQSGTLNQMIFTPDVLLQYIKDHFPLESGDLILTGTPAGVGPLKSGDELRATLSLQGQVLLENHWKIQL